MKSHINVPQNSLISEKKYFAARGDMLSAEKLREEKNFKSYLDMLWGFAQRYCVMVAAKGTPCGSAFTREISDAFMNVGFNTDLRGKDYCGYAAIIDSGRIVFEILEPDTKKAINVLGALDTGDEAEIFSSGDRSIEVNKGLISVCGSEYSPNGRGLNFVVYDKVTKTVIDAVCFDTSDFVEVFRPENYKEKFKNYLQRHSGVTLLGFDVMHIPHKNPTAAERAILSNELTYHKLKDNVEDFQFVLNKYFNSEEISEVLEIPPSYRDIYGVIRFADKHGKLVNIIDGHRVTAFQPRHNANNRCVYLCGICLSFGLGADDKKTTASCLQQMINGALPESGIIVHNYGSFLENTDETEEVLRLIENLPVKNGDIILWNADSYVLNRAGIPIIDIYELAEKPHDVDLFFDTFHYTPDGQRMVAQKLFEELMSRGALSQDNADAAQSNYGFSQSLSEELEQYKGILKNYYNEMFTPTVGAVVMNCNPFTLGHRYLIEKSLELCDFLVIFVVEEDKSVFPFEDRLRLVDEGVKDLSNVTVIPSGRFIISSLTFSEYFNKSEIQDRTVDTSLDVSVFAREIAPCLHIVKRFAGEEPFDSVTRQYNETMSKVLPEYGIEFVEIPRAEIRGEAISASKVRKMILDGNLEGVREFVPKTTFEYLLELFGKDGR